MDSIPCHRGSAVFLGTMASNFKGTLTRALRGERQRETGVVHVCLLYVLRVW